MTTLVLIVGQLPDPHIDAVARELETLGAAPILFNRLCPEESRITYRLENDAADGEIATAHGAIRLSEVRAVWWRVKPFSLAEYGAEPMPVVEGFIDREWRSVLNALTAFTPRAFWINPRAADLVAREKPVQLCLARQAGLAIPATRISNDPTALADFADTGEGTIYKPVTWYADIPDRFIFTSQVELEQIHQKAEEIQVAPGIFQRRIPKAYELRVTIIGERLFSVRIDSQALAGAELDWRRRQSRLHYVPCAPPDDVCDRLLVLHGKLGLVYGAYDLIVTPEGEHVFLEVNPSGQWLWLELHTGLPISRELAGCLVRSC
ncbi:MAG: ATP-dependent carboxylate-amine ligase [Thermoleophilia bacterium]|nr:ATP-dependent carboxylate-amine ligase [Thermoleophilia bacterium]